MKTYVRVKLKLPGGMTRTTWAVDLGATKSGKIRSFRPCDVWGDERDELIVASPLDIEWLKPAQFNKKYATLEVIP